MSFLLFTVGKSDGWIEWVGFLHLCVSCSCIENEVIVFGKGMEFLVWITGKYTKTLQECFG